MTNSFWQNRRVLVTGHMGFKGSWLVSLLSHLGATTVGFGFDRRPDPLLFRLLKPDNHNSIEADINETKQLQEVLQEHDIETVFHLAAQPFVLASYADPLGTFRDNVLGTASVLEAARGVDTVKAVVVVTSDKVYENREWHWAYRETDRLGGMDPYSASKAAAEIVTRSMAQSFFGRDGAASVATVRAGNVIGGGDWGENRLVPDAARAFSRGEELVVRNPAALRPWQHVLDPLRGYLAVGEHLLTHRPAEFGSWNLGPDTAEFWPVSRIANKMVELWKGARWSTPENDAAARHEATLLAVDSSRAKTELGWSSAWATDEAIEKTISWYRDYYEGKPADKLVAADIEAFLAACG